MMKEFFFLLLQFSRRNKKGHGFIGLGSRLTKYNDFFLYVWSLLLHFSKSFVVDRLLCSRSFLWPFVVIGLETGQHPLFGIDINATLTTH